MDETSFDPRKWGKANQPAGKNAAPAGTEEPAQTVRPTTQLPAAWEAVATDFRPGAKLSEPAAPDAPTDHCDRPRGFASTLLVAALIVVLCAGAAIWWLRTPSVPAVEPPASVAALMPGPSATAIERALNLMDVSQLAEALKAVGIAEPEADAAAQAVRKVMAAPGEIRARIVLAPRAGQPAGGLGLERLQASYSDGSGVVVTRDEDGTFAPHKVAAELTRQVKVLRGELDSESFYTSAVTAGLTDTLIPEFINAFAYDFNLASEVAPGDTFEVAYEQSVNENGDAVGQPQLLFASLTTQQKSLALYRFRLPDGSVAWYDGNGAATQRGFMRTPIDGARITSKFGMRFHPVLHYTRLHGGVDFGAPIGTPIYAAADGTVTSASPSKCAGNMVIIQHANGYETRYFHLSRYADGLHAGEQVTQGYVVGFVGTTGTCTTGPHLHYEVHINGEKIDPLSVKTDDSKRKRLDTAGLAGFMRERDRIDVARAKQAF